MWKLWKSMALTGKLELAAVAVWVLGSLAFGVYIVVHVVANPSEGGTLWSALPAIPVFILVGAVAALPCVALAAILAGHEPMRQALGGVLCLVLGVPTAGVVVWAMAPGISLEGDLDFVALGLLLGIAAGVTAIVGVIALGMFVMREIAGRELHPAG